jgi:hypothetical protein
MDARFTSRRLAAAAGAGPAPLDPHEARARLLFTLVLLSELGAIRLPARRDARTRLPRVPAAGPAAGAVPRPARRRLPVRPPRAC